MTDAELSRTIRLFEGPPSGQGRARQIIIAELTRRSEAFISPRDIRYFLTSRGELRSERIIELVEPRVRRKAVAR